MHRFSVLVIAAASLAFSLTAPVSAESYTAPAASYSAPPVDSYSKSGGSYASYGSSCKSDDYRCDSSSMFSKCDNNSWVQFACPSGTTCDINHFLSTHGSPCVTSNNSYSSYGQTYSPPPTTYNPPANPSYSAPPAYSAPPVQSYSNDYGATTNYKGNDYVEPNYTEHQAYPHEDKSISYDNNQSYDVAAQTDYQGDYRQQTYNTGKVYLERRATAYSNSYTPQYSSNNYNNNYSNNKDWSYTVPYTTTTRWYTTDYGKWNNNDYNKWNNYKWDNNYNSNYNNWNTQYGQNKWNNNNYGRNSYDNNNYSHSSYNNNDYRKY